MSLIAHWPFDGDLTETVSANDAVGNGYYGFVGLGSPKLLEPLPSSGWFSYPNDLFRNKTAVSIAFWLYLTVNISTMGTSNLINELTSATKSRIALDVNTGATSKVRIVVRDASQDPDGSPTLLSSTSPIPTRTLTHVVAIFDSVNDQLVIYIAGTQDAVSNVALGATADTASSVRNIFGWNNAMGVANEYAQMADLRIYDHVLSQAEITALATLPSGGGGGGISMGRLIGGV
jgi:Concanavalin A-like lectin/glucanases superfamily